MIDIKSRIMSSRKFAIGFIILWIVCFLIGFTLLCLGVFTAWHFIQKAW
jgi:hypothetical protein